jgi:CRP-like cAMP-binding protein
MIFEDLVRAIRGSPFFHGMAQEEQISLARLGRVDVYPPGGVLFRPGETPSALYLVLEGVVEICREESPEVGLQPVAYLGVGSTVSESKVLTGAALNSLGHFPEGGTTLQWPRPVLLRHLYSSPDLALHYMQQLARRLEGTIAHLGAHSGSNLRGRLDQFDLPAILQTVVDSGATGVLEISDVEGQTFGAIHTRSRMIGRIMCGRLEGTEAFLEILNSPPENGTFRFSNLSVAPETDTYRQVQPLLLEAARIQDELGHFAATVPETALLQPATRRLNWRNDTAADLVEQIWHQLSAQPCGWGMLAELLPFSKGQIALTVRDMLLAGVLSVNRNNEITGGERARGS